MYILYSMVSTYRMEPEARPTFSSSVSSLLQASRTASAMPEEFEKFAAAASA
jgi:hypothetical protein